MVLRALPADYAPGDVPTAAEMNGLKDHAGYHVDRYTTVLRRTTTVQLMAHNAFTAIQWNSVVSGYNGLGWSSGTSTRIPIPSGADGRFTFHFTGEFNAAAGGYRYTALAKNGALLQPGLFCPGDGTLTSWLATSWESQGVGGDYFEIWLYQNKTTVGTLALNVTTAEAPQVSVRRVEL